MGDGVCWVGGLDCVLGCVGAGGLVLFRVPGWCCCCLFGGVRLPATGVGRLGGWDGPVVPCGMVVGSGCW